MATTLSRYARRLKPAATALASSSVASTSYVVSRSLSASARRYDDEKPPHQPASDQPSASTSSDSDSKQSAERASYKPPSQASRAWPFDSSSSSSNDAAPPISDASSSTPSNPYAGLFEGTDPFPTVSIPTLTTTTTTTTTPSSEPSWLSDQLDTLSTPRSPRRSSSDSGKSPIPRSVLFADSDRARQSPDFKPRPPPSRKRFDRTPLTQQEANAFMSLLNQALAGTSSPSPQETPFGSYTSLISNPRTQSGSKALLQAFATRNRLKRFEEARAQRAKRFVREGLAGRVDVVQLEAGVDEAREQMAMCENLSELLEWAKREVWGIGTITAGEEGFRGLLEEQSAEGKVEGKTPKYGKDTPFYPSVLHLLFLTIRDRYRAPHVALSIPRTTRALGIESYVLGVTGSLYNELLKTQWDWLGDLPGVVSTLRQARETGILSAPIRHTARNDEEKAKENGGLLAGSEDESIRETVDRIANEVRKYVLDSHPQGEVDVLTGQSTDVLAAEGRKHRVEDWSEKWLLEKAEEATGLAGKPFRLMQKRSSRFDKARSQYGSGDGERRPFNRRSDGHQGREARGGKERYPANGFGSRPPRRGSMEVL